MLDVVAGNGEYSRSTRPSGIAQLCEVIPEMYDVWAVIADEGDEVGLGLREVIERCDGIVRDLREGEIWSFGPQRKHGGWRGDHY